MHTLNLPKYSFRLSKKEEKLYIFDDIRKKKIFLTPEEWVRQHFIQFLINEQKYPKSWIAVEKEIKVNNLDSAPFSSLPFFLYNFPSNLWNCIEDVLNPK